MDSESMTQKWFYVEHETKIQFGFLYTFFKAIVSETTGSSSNLCVDTVPKPCLYVHSTKDHSYSQPTYPLSAS